MDITRWAVILLWTLACGFGGVVYWLEGDVYLDSARVEWLCSCDVVWAR